MKPQFLKVSTGPEQSFSVRRDLVPQFNNKWHYHPEIELIHFKKGKGMQFVGDSIMPFSDGDVVLIGTQLPHCWRFDNTHFQADCRQSADVRVIHFCDTFWGKQFLSLPENKLLVTMLEKARRGIKVKGSTRVFVAGLLEKMLNSGGAEKIVLLMRALLAIAACNEVNLLSSSEFWDNSKIYSNDRINAVYEYSLANFKKKIELKEIAEVAYLSPHSFCRYFKFHTKKTYTQFLIELKVSHACKLLIENKMIIKQVCYESGFNNFASFYKFFKLITGKSPISYQKEFCC